MTKGTIEFDGKRVDKLTTNDLVRMGVIQVMEGRPLLAHLTVEENLLTGRFTRKDRAPRSQALEKVYHRASRGSNSAAVPRAIRRAASSR